MTDVRFRHVAVEGPIGVGKTSFVDALSRRLGAESVLEDATNPFLADFYGDQAGSAFQVQLYFLLTRYRQQLELRQRSLFNPVSVADYMFEKDRLFAHLNLSDNELLIYEKVYEILVPAVPRPDLVIYLQASTDVLMQRIRLRRRDVELDIAPEYVEQVNEAYRHYFHNYRASSLLVLNTNDIDFVKNPRDLDELVAQIERMEGGTQYFVPPSSRED